MTEYSQKHNNPIGIWQGIWADLFRTIIGQVAANDFVGAFKSLELLRVMLPPECEKDVATIYPKVETLLKKTAVGFNHQNAIEHKITQLHNEMPNALLGLIGEIRNSLYTRNWINKDFSIHPRQGTAHIRCPT